MINLQYLIIKMQVLKKFSSLLRLQSHTPAYLFADKWKDRDEASEKVYITEAEKTTLKKLLKKVEIESDQRLQSNSEFQGKLKEILKKHKVNNEAFFSEVSNLHKNNGD